MDKALWLTFWGPPCMSCHQRRTIEHRAEIHSQNDWIISSHQKRTQQPEKQTTTGIINYKYTYNTLTCRNISMTIYTDLFIMVQH